MTKKQIKKIANKSYTRGSLDTKKVESIARLLKRSELKEYLRAIKALEERSKVVVILPRLDDLKREDVKKTFVKLFPNKRVMFEEDQSLMVGVKIINNDEIFEFNLNNTLDNLSSYIEESYD